MLKHKIVALLPMKGNSERVPNKNIRKFAGKPLFYHIIEVLENVPAIASIIINTDSECIEALASGFSKVVIHKRPPEICGGHIPMNEIIRNDLDRTEGEWFLQTHSTNPLLKAGTLIDAINTFFEINSSYDSLFSATKIQQRLYDRNFNPINHDPEILLNTQDLNPVFGENSCIYIFSRTSFFKKNNRIGNKPFVYVMNQEESYDIDTEDDFRITEDIFISNNILRKHNA